MRYDFTVLWNLTAKVSSSFVQFSMKQQIFSPEASAEFMVTICATMSLPPCKWEQKRLNILLRHCIGLLSITGLINHAHKTDLHVNILQFSIRILVRGCPSPARCYYHFSNLNKSEFTQVYKILCHDIWARHWKQVSDRECENDRRRLQLFNFI